MDEVVSKLRAVDYKERDVLATGCETVWFERQGGWCDGDDLIQRNKRAVESAMRQDIGYTR